MLLKIQLLFLMFTTQTQSKDHEIIVKLDPAEIIKTLATESSLKYLQQLADVFAKKAAEKFVDEIRNKEYNFINNEHRKIQDKVHKAILDEGKAFALLQTPEPDGDNLELDSVDLTKEEETKKSVPVVGLMKVNGKYVRRLLGLLD